MTDTVYNMPFKHNGVTRYTHWPFKRVVRFMGLHIGMTGTTLNTIGGSTANGAAIDGLMKLATIDMSSPQQKRVASFYMGYRPSGNVALDVQTDDNAAVTYAIDNAGATGLTQRRVPIARGQRGRYWTLTVRSVNGSRLDIDNMELVFDDLKRRVSSFGA